MTEFEQVVVLAINDYHSQIEPLTKVLEDGRSVTLGGAKRLANLIAQERKKCEEKDAKLLLVAVGDVFLGSEYFTFFNGEVEMKLLELLKFDILSLGNHEFDQGGLENILTQRKKMPSVDMMCANVVYKTGERCFTSYKIFDVNGFKVGVTAVLGHEAWSVISITDKKDLMFIDMFERCKEIVEEAESTEGKINLWICMSHTGYDRGDTELAKLGLFDIIFSGHEHFTQPKLDWAKFKNAAGGRTSYLHPGNAHAMAVQKIEFTFNSGSLTVDTILLDDTFEDESTKESNEITQFLKPYADDIEDIANQVLAFCESECYTKQHFAENFSATELHPISHLVLDMHFFIYSHTHIKPKVQFPEENLLTLYNLGGMRGSIPKGEICIKHATQVLPFPSKLEIIEVFGKNLKKLHSRNMDRLSRNTSSNPPGMFYHVKWFKDEKNLEELDNEEKFYVLLTQYLRENDFSDLLHEGHEMGESLEHAVIWDMTHLPAQHVIKETQVGFQEFLKVKKVLK